MITHKIISQKNYAYIEIKGQPDVRQFIQAAQLFIDDPDYAADVHRLCDFSQADLEHITIEHFGEFVEFAVANITLAKGTRVALVAPDNEHTSIYHSFAEHVDSGTFQVFVDPAAAVEWIREATRFNLQNSNGNQHVDRLLRLG